jgi:hypothetical protein
MAEYPDLSDSIDTDKTYTSVFTQQKSLDELYGRLDRLEARVQMLEGSTRFTVDELGDQIILFLKRYAELKFNTGSVAANIGRPSQNLSDKLHRMAEKGLIRSEKLEGQSTMFWYEEKPNGSVENL